MADGLCSGDVVAVEIEKTLVKEGENGVGCEKDDSVSASGHTEISGLFVRGDCVARFGDLCAKGTNASSEGFSDMEMNSLEDDDCRKKRCVDRYDSSESSDRSVFDLCSKRGIFHRKGAKRFRGSEGLDRAT